MLKDQIQRTENTILKTLFFLSETSLRGDVTKVAADVTPGEENLISDEHESHGFESDQENINPEDRYAVSKHSFMTNKCLQNFHY